jgi:2-polyprenyl-3-methyl-5-hydroxy-6-metoxy-1,4-benzoquinol methylase
MNDKQHWNQVYLTSETTKLGWYEETPQPSLDLIDKCNLDKDASILDVGTGVTTLIENLIADSYTNIIATDISEIALDTAQKRLSKEKARYVHWIADDITKPNLLHKIGKIDLWHDRTVLHFLTEESQQKGYLETLKSLVKKKGYVIIAVFSLEGARKCSGLDVKNYDHQMISDFLGSEFELLEYLPHIYTKPSGYRRPYVYTRFQRQD